MVNVMSSLLITLQRNRDYVNLQLLKTPAVAWARDIDRQRELFQQCRPEILIFNYCLFFAFDFWPLAIDIDFAFWPTTSGSAPMLL